MTENNKPNNAKYVNISANELAALVHDRTELATMLSNLILMWKHEDKLKQHHRPYLHVRKETEKLCDAYLKRLSEMSRHGVHIRFYEASANVPVSESSTQVNKAEISIIVRDMTEDILTLMEYLDIQRSFISLLKSGTKMEGVTDKFGCFLNKELDDMMDRLNKAITEYSHESE